MTSPVQLLIAGFLVASAAAAPPAKPPTMGLLTKTVTGERVIAAGYAEWDAPPPPMADAALVSRLQAIGEAAPSPSGKLIPFVVRKAWVLAPETREEVNLDLSGADPMLGLSRDTLLGMAVTSLSAGQMKRLGSERGLALSEFPEKARAAIRAAFRPPLSIWSPAPKTEGGDSSGGNDAEGADQRPLTEPLDPGATRIRAYLKSNAVWFDAAEGRRGDFSEPPPSNWPRFTTGGVGDYPHAAPDPPFLQDVPNRFKPSDLEGKAYSQPIGVHGAFKLPDALKRLETVTGLRLTCASGYKWMPVFIGRDDIACGELIDGLRLALCASWRKLGDTYILAWDRRGLAALQQSADESVEAYRARMYAASEELDSSPGWLTLAHNLPFAPDDPMALDEQQRRRLFDADQGLDDAGDKRPRLPFAQMRPEQQAHIRSLIGETATLLGSPGSQQVQQRPASEADASAAYLSPGCNVEISVELSGVGWVAAPPGWGAGMLNEMRLSEAHGRAEGGAVSRWDQMAQRAKPCALPAETRALMVPIVPAARLVALADEMKAHGLNTLLYPALHNGYATIASDRFPLHPALGGEDGLAAAARLMKPAGIRVIPYVSMFSWRGLGDKTHWLDAHPDWIDVDALGRSRRALTRSDPRRKRRAELAPTADGDAVRPTEPAVAARLKAFVAELAAHPEAATIAFASGYTTAPRWASAWPRLGYALPERIAAVRAGRTDPVDVMAGDQNDPHPFDARSLGAAIAWTVEMPADPETEPSGACESLLAMLTSQARAARKGIQVWAIDEALAAVPARPLDPPARPAGGADLLIPSSSGAAMRSSLICIVPSDPNQGRGGAAESRRLPEIAYGLLRFNRPADTARYKAIVLDFRSCPGEITESLKWVLPTAADGGAAPGA